MKPRPIALSGIGLAAALLLLSITWLLASPGETTAGGPSTTLSGIPTPSTPAPDPRWLSLLRSPHPYPLRLQASAPSINVHLTDRFVAGRVGLVSSVTISVTRAGARIAHAVVTPIPDSSGFFYMAHLTWAGAEYGSGGDCGGGTFQPGDVVWVAQSGLATTMTVPALSSLADAPTDVISGSAPPSQPVTLYLFPFADPDIIYTRTVTASEAGTYHALWTPLDLRPGDSGYIAYAESSDRRAYARFVTPLLRAQVDGMDVSGMAAPCSEVEITVCDSEGIGRAAWWTSTGANGHFTSWEYSEKYGYTLRPGDQVLAMAAGQTFSTTVLAVTAHTDLAGEQVRGEAPAGSPVAVMHFAGPLTYGWDNLWEQFPVGQTLVTSTASGLYTASLPLANADYGAACAFSPEGHQTCARFAVPYLRVRMGTASGGGYALGYQARGQVDAPSVPITIALQSARGYLRDIRRLTAAGNGYFQDIPQYGESLTVDTGDVITVTTPRGVQIALVLPPLTAEAHPLSDTVSGLAPPNARLIVAILYDEYPVPPTPPPPTALGGGPAPPPPYYGYAVRVVTATAEGRYLADFSGEVNITNATVGEVSMDIEGHTVVRPFRATTGCRPMLTHVHVGGNSLEGVSDFGCPTLTLRLYDTRGYLKAARLFDFTWTPYFYAALYENEVYPYGKSRPIPIQTGDRIELAWADQAIITVIPTLTVALDPLADVISGEAPPGAFLELRVYNYGPLTTTVGAQGTYSLSLAGKYDVVPGDLANGVYVQDSTYYVALGAVPSIRAGLYQNWVSGILPPLTPYTIALETTPPATVTGYAGPDGDWGNELPARTKPGDTITLTTPNSALRLSLPFLSAWVDRAEATVAGQAPANARLRVDLTDWQYIDLSREITATAAGTYTVSFPDLAPLEGIQGTLTYFNAEGNQVFLLFANRQWHVTLSQPCVWGYADMVGASFTATLQASESPPDSTFGGTSDVSGYFYGCFERAIQPGDRLTLVQPGATMSFTVPTLTVYHHYAQQILEGEAPAGSFLEVVFYTSSGSVVRHTRADYAGHYALDTAGIDLRPAQTGYVAMTDEAGNTLRAEFVITGYRVYMPLICK